MLLAQKGSSICLQVKLLKSRHKFYSTGWFKKNFTQVQGHFSTTFSVKFRMFLNFVQATISYQQNPTPNYRGTPEGKIRIEKEQPEE